jgi:hypothetical protein
MSSQPQLSACPPQDLRQSLLVPAVAPTQNDTRRDFCTNPDTAREIKNAFKQSQDQTVSTEQSKPIENHTLNETMSKTDLTTGFSAPVACVEPATPQIPVEYGPYGVKGPVSTHLMTLEEWDAQWDAMHPLPKLSAAKLAEIASLEKLTPVLRKHNPDAIPTLNHLCQVHDLTALFTIKNVNHELFSAKLELGEHVFEERGPFTSKKFAKEAVAERGLDVLKSIAPPRKERRVKPARKESSGSDSASNSGLAEEGWVAILNNFAQLHRHPRPDYQYFEHNNRMEQVMGVNNNPIQYACTVSLQARPQYLFGSDTTFHQAKVEAKRLAAKEAVTWLRAVGKLAEAPLTPSTKTPSPRNTADASPAQLVASLSLSLRLCPPSFECKPTAEKNYYTCTANFLEYDAEVEPGLKGPLCQTAPIHGQKNAKKMCCQDLLPVLERIAARRAGQLKLELSDV